MDKQLVIPDKLKIGFNKRDDTYSGKLGFITFPLKDGTNKHKKSWDNWIDKKITVLDIDNSPTEGFVLNRNEGGGGRWSYNEREAKIRVWHPSGFEFEITIPNMLDILQTCGSYPGKGLEGKFVFAFSNTKLHLLPVKSEEYRNSVEFTDLSKLSITKDELIVGASYITKKQENLVYMGFFPWVVDRYWTSSQIKIAKNHIFYDGSKKNPHYYIPDRNEYEDMTEEEIDQAIKEETVDMGPEFMEEFAAFKITDIAKCIDKTPVPNLAELVDKLQEGGRVFSRDKVRIRKTPMVCKQFKEKQWSTHGVYEQEELWIKKDENVYEGVRFRLEFDKDTIKKSNESRYSYRSNADAKANGISIEYVKKITISDENAVVAKCAKVDKKIYSQREIEDMEFYKVQFDMTEMVTKEMLSSSYNKKQKADYIKQYSMKEIA